MTAVTDNSQHFPYTKAMKNKVIRWGQERLTTHLFKDEKKAVLEKLGQLENALNNLQYEGKLFSSGHINKAEDVVRFLKKKYTAHIKLDNNIIFPFLERHIPKLHPVLLYLRAERREFQEGFKIFEETLSELKRGNKDVIRHGIIGRLKDRGIYLICLMRSHIQLEEQSVYEGITRGLHKDEKSALIQKVVHFMQS